MIGRLYIRRFQQAGHVVRLLGTVETHVKGRVAAVTASLACFVPTSDPTVMIELWEYPDEESMQWVRQSLQGATGSPMPCCRKTKSTLLIWLSPHNAEWD